MRRTQATPAADGSDSGSDGGSSGGGCFSAMNTVEVQGKGTVSMEDLKIGDYVFDGSDYTQVFSFGHKDVDAKFEFVQIHTEGSNKPLELTFNHMLYLDNKAVTAATVSVGDKLGSKSVTKIETVQRTGVFAPITYSGKIEVSDIKASSYVALMDHVVEQHSLVHMFYAPHRVACAIDFSICETKPTRTDSPPCPTLAFSST